MWKNQEKSGFSIVHGLSRSSWQHRQPHHDLPKHHLHFPKHHLHLPKHHLQRSSGCIPTNTQTYQRDRYRSSSGSCSQHTAPAMLWQQRNASAGKPDTQPHRSSKRGFQLQPQPIRAAHRITGHSGGFQRYASGCAPAGGVRPMGRFRRYAYPAKQPTKHTAPHRGCQTEARSHAPFADFSHPQTSSMGLIALRPGPQQRA